MLNRKDKSNKDSGDTSYRQGQIDTQLKNILNKLEKIEDKLNVYDEEIDKKIDIALEHHIREYHRRNTRTFICYGIAKRSKKAKQKNVYYNTSHFRNVVCYYWIFNICP